MSDIMVVGSAGFIGSNLCNYLVQHTKYNIASLDDLSTMPDLRNLQPSINSKYRHSFYLAEAESAKIIGKIFELEKPKTIIYNLAATHLDQIGMWRLSYVDAVKTLRMWFDLAFLHGAEKFIIISNPKVLYEPLSAEQQEYVATCEGASIDYADKFGVYVLKPCNVFGPRQSIAAPIPKIFTSVLEGNFDEDFWAGGPQDWMYIKDLFYNVLSFVDNNYASGAYYLRNTEHMSKAKIWELAQNIVAGGNTLRPSHIDEFSVPNEETVEHKYFNWAPQYKIANALEHTFCWYDANRWAWR